MDILFITVNRYSHWWVVGFEILAITESEMMHPEQYAINYKANDKCYNNCENRFHILFGNGARKLF